MSPRQRQKRILRFTKQRPRRHEMSLTDLSKKIFFVATLRHVFFVTSSSKSININDRQKNLARVFVTFQKYPQKWFLVICIGLLKYLLK